MNVLCVHTNVYECVLVLDRFVVMSISSFFNTLSKTHAMFRSSTLANYIVWQLVRDFESVLSEPFESAKSKFASVLYGGRGAAPRWRRCVDRLNTAMMFVVGSLYVDEHFSSGDKKKVCRDSLKHLHHYRLRYSNSMFETSDIIRLFISVIRHLETIHK